MDVVAGVLDNVDTEVSLDGCGDGWPEGSFWVSLRDVVPPENPLLPSSERAHARVQDGALIVTRPCPYAHAGAVAVSVFVRKGVTVDCASPDAPPVVAEILP